MPKYHISTELAFSNSHYLPKSCVRNVKIYAAEYTFHSYLVHYFDVSQPASSAGRPVSVDLAIDYIKIDEDDFD